MDNTKTYTFRSLSAEQADFLVTMLQEVAAPMKFTAPLQFLLVQQLTEQGHPKTASPPA